MRGSESWNLTEHQGRKADNNADYNSTGIDGVGLHAVEYDMGHGQHGNKLAAQERAVLE